MPLSRWFRGGAPSLRDRVVKGLQQARDGDADGAIETIGERFSDGLGELRALRARARRTPRPGTCSGGFVSGSMMATPSRLFGAPRRCVRNITGFRTASRAT